MQAHVGILVQRVRLVSFFLAATTFVLRRTLAATELLMRARSRALQLVSAFTRWRKTARLTHALRFATDMTSARQRQVRTVRQHIRTL